MSCVHELFDTARLNAISITEVARRLGEVRRAGSVYKTYCPWHEDRHPSLTLYERTNENRCHCFACGRGGSVIDFVMQHESWTFQEACRWLSNEFGISTLRADSQQTWHRTVCSPQPRPRAAVKPAEPTYTYIPKEMVESLVSMDNSLSRCLVQMFDPAAVKRVGEDYLLGRYAMKGLDDYTVFPNIDVEGRVCNLKVQHYETDRFSPRFAHSDPGSCRWLGSIWSAEGRVFLVYLGGQGVELLLRRVVEVERHPVEVAGPTFDASGRELERAIARKRSRQLDRSAAARARVLHLGSRLPIERESAGYRPCKSDLL